MDEESIFLQALEKPTLAERVAFVEQACAGNAELRRGIEGLLEAHERAGNFLQAKPGIATVDTPVSEGAGTVIGPYKLLEQIGEGGFGIVFMAEQQQPLRRKVALKVLKPGMDTRQVIARFEAERQALALMDHPNIAHVFDGGETAGGRPYFVMELVKGMPVTHFCDQSQLTPKDRLELFLHVCQAVQHAHLKGIIHRDIKPSNVLVTLHDGTPVVKVIDFGIAKATGQQLTEKTLFTNFAQLIGTPLYMSPEQAALSGLDVDTRSDVYSLGVLLYELLTGTTPFTKERFKEAGYDEIRRIIREEEPPRPSTRISTLGQAATTISTQRQSDPKRLSQLFRGELDWIVMKCLEKDRNRRYETANALARDIQLYLADEMVEARPPSAGYRLRKLVRRNKARVIAAALLLLALVAGVIGTSLGLIEANEQAGNARKEAAAQVVARANADWAAEEEKKARHEEERQRKFAEAMAGFVRDDFLALTSVEGQTRFAGELGDTGLSKNTTLHELLDRAAKKLSQRDDLDPRSQAELHWMIGVNYRGLGQANLAIPHLERSLLLRQQVFGRDAPETLNAQNSLAVAYDAVGQYDKAVPLLQETVNLTKANLGPDDPETLFLMNNLAVAYRAAGQLDKSLPLSEETLKLTKAKLGPDHDYTLRSMASLASAYQSAGRLDKAMPLSRETLKLRKAKLGLYHFLTLASMNNLAAAYLADGQLDKALPLLEETLKLREVKLGRDHPDTLRSMMNLAVAYANAGRLDKALPLSEETLKLTKTALGPDHPYTLASMNCLGNSYRDGDKLDKAVPLLEDTLKLREVLLGRDHPDTLTSRNSLAFAYQAASQLDKALPLSEETLKLTKTKLGPHHPDTLTSMNSLAESYQMAGRLTQALPLLNETLQLRKDKLGPDHADTLTSMNNLARGYLDAGKLRQALPLFEEALRLAKAKLGDDHPITLTAMNNLALGYQDAGKLQQALPLYQETLRLRKDKLGPDHRATLTVMNNLAMAYLDLRKFEQALPLLQETLRLRKAKLGPDDPKTLLSMNNLAFGYRAAGKLEQALPLYQETLRRRKNELGPGHPDTLISMNNLAVAYQAAGQFEKALPLFQETLRIRTAKLGPEHRHTLISMANLAAGYRKARRLDQSVPLLEKTLKLQAESLGRTHPDTQGTLGFLGVNYKDAGRLKEALPLLEEAYSASRRHPRLRWVGPELLDGYAKANKSTAAVALLNEMLADARKTLPKDSPQLAAAFEQFALVLLEARLFTDAERLCHDALAIRLKDQPDAWSTFNTQLMLGAAHLGRKKYVEAEPLLLNGYEGLRQRAAKIPLQSKARLTEAEGRLAELFEATRAKDESKLPGRLTDTKAERVHEVKLAAGKPAVIEMHSKQFDTYLRLLDEKGATLAENNDIDFAGRNLDSRIVFIPAADGVYRIIATSFQQRGRGDYEIIIRRYSAAKRK